MFIARSFSIWSGTLGKKSPVASSCRWVWRCWADTLPALLVGRRTDQRRQVVEDELLGDELGRQDCRVFAFVDCDLPGEIAVANAPLALDELPDAWFAIQLAGDVVGRRRRAGDAEQRIDVGEVVARTT